MFCFNKTKHKSVMDILIFTDFLYIRDIYPRIPEVTRFRETLRSKSMNAHKVIYYNNYKYYIRYDSISDQFSLHSGSTIPSGMQLGYLCPTNDAVNMFVPFLQQKILQRSKMLELDEATRPQRPRRSCTKQHGIVQRLRDIVSESLSVWQSECEASLGEKQRKNFNDMSYIFKTTRVNSIKLSPYQNVYYYTVLVNSRPYLFGFSNSSRNKFDVNNPLIENVRINEDAVVTTCKKITPGEQIRWNYTWSKV